MIGCLPPVMLSCAREPPPMTKKTRTPKTPTPAKINVAAKTAATAAPQILLQSTRELKQGLELILSVAGIFCSFFLRRFVAFRLCREFLVCVLPRPSKSPKAEKDGSERKSAPDKRCKTYLLCDAC